MQRLNKPAHAPLGTAFFLFMSLAIIPVSLKAAGLQTGFSPRLSAANRYLAAGCAVVWPDYEPRKRVRVGCADQLRERTIKDCGE